MLCIGKLLEEHLYFIKGNRVVFLQKHEKFNGCWGRVHDKTCTIVLQSLVLNILNLKMHIQHTLSFSNSVLYNNIIHIQSQCYNTSIYIYIYILKYRRFSVYPKVFIGHIVIHYYYLLGCLAPNAECGFIDRFYKVVVDGFV